MALAPRPASPVSPSRDAACAFALAAVTFASVAAPAPWLDPPAAAATFFDDAFYYFQIARNVAGGAGFTFDGLHATSGFHPLWLFVLVPVFAIFPGDMAPLRAVLAIEASLVAAAAVMVFDALRPRLGRAAAAAAALLLLVQPAATRTLRGGMESALVLCLFALVWARWLRVRDEPDAPPRRWLALGAWCAALFLARLEAILALPVLVALAWSPLLADRRRLIALLLPPAACAAAYLAWTALAFGTWGPVSAEVKAQFGAQGWAAQTPLQRSAFVLYMPWAGDWAARRALALLGLDPAAAPAVASLLLAALLLFAFRRRAAVRRAVARGGIAFVLATAAAMIVADKVALGLMLDWYRAPVFLATAVAAGVALASAPRAARVTAGTLGVVAVAAIPIAVWRAAHPAVPAPAGLRVAEWVRARASRPGEAGSWNAGLIGYFAGGGIVNLDGLVNDARFAREVAVGKDLPGYLRREGIRWLADGTLEDGRLAPLLRRYPDAVVRAVEARYRLVASFPGTCPPGSPCSVVAIWESTEPASPAER
jgi:hypothetical protein